MKKYMGKIFVSITLLLGVSCGRDEGNKDANESYFLNLNSQLDKRFTPEEIRQVYTNAPAPAQTDYLGHVYTMADAPAAFKAEWPVFTKAVEMKGFLNMSASPTGGDPNDDPTARSIVGTLEAFSKWKEITDKSGRKILEDAYTVDNFGEKMPDKTNGRIANNPDIHLGKIVGNGIPILLELKFSTKDNGQIDADFTNPKAISIFPVGTIISAKGLKIHVEFFPYQNGWLYYSVAAPKLEKFEEKANDLNVVAESIVLWLRKKVGK